MLQGSSTANVSERRGRSIHQGRRTLPLVPPQQSTAQTAFNLAAIALFPWPGDSYPGIERGMFATLGARSKVDLIRKYRHGARRPPVWAMETVLAALDAKLAALEHARALLAAEIDRRAKP